MEKVYKCEYGDYEYSIEKFFNEAILADSDLKDVTTFILGYWPECQENSPQLIIDGMIERKDKFEHIEHFKFGFMDAEECEISWISQGDYAEFINTFKNMKSLTIQGSTGLSPNMSHAELQSLEIISGGTPKSAFININSGDFPNLQKLHIYAGIDSYGCDMSVEDFTTFINEINFPKLMDFGVMNSEVQDKIAEIILDSAILKQLKVWNLSYGSLSDLGAQLLLDNVDKIKHLDKITIDYHFLSDEMIEKLGSCEVEILLDNQEEVDDYNDVEPGHPDYDLEDVYMDPLYTE